MLQTKWSNEWKESSLLESSTFDWNMSFGATISKTSSQFSMLVSPQNYALLRMLKDVIFPISLPHQSVLHVELCSGVSSADIVPQDVITVVMDRETSPIQSKLSPAI